MITLSWEPVRSDYSRNGGRSDATCVRAKVFGGWLVQELSMDFGAPITFIPDPGHVWGTETESLSEHPSHTGSTAMGAGRAQIHEDASSIVSDPVSPHLPNPLDTESAILEPALRADRKGETRPLFVAPMSPEAYQCHAEDANPKRSPEHMSTQAMLDDVEWLIDLAGACRCRGEGAVGTCPRCCLNAARRNLRSALGVHS